MGSEAPPTPEAKGQSAPARGRGAAWRVLALVALIAGLLAAGHATRAGEILSREHVRALMLELGARGFVAYVVIFALGELLHVPGMVFVAAAMLAYGRGAGFAAGLVGSLVSVSTSFWVVRLVGGQPLTEIRSPLLLRVLRRLEQRPVATVALLRIVLWLTPALNYTLAMSPLRFRDYLFGSALGLLPPLAVAALAFDWLFS
jgi:uncharacterized membrane protein YdjX (TVP38/TMEM64 family)